MKKLLRPNRDK